MPAPPDPPEVPRSVARLSHAIGLGGYFALAFGAIVGSGWVVVLGDWLRAAGPGGTVVGFLAGALVTAIIVMCYGELASRFPTAGAEFMYTFETLGARPAFLVGWFITLYAVAVCAFEAIALGWLVRTLLPAVSLGTAYTIADTPVTWDGLGIGTTAALLIGVLHYRGASSAISFQNVVTYAFIAVSTVVILCGLSFGSLANVRPVFSPAIAGRSLWSGIFWIFSTCAFFLAGWQAAFHAIEERRSSVSTSQVVGSAVAAVAGAALFYSAIVVSAACTVPWLSLIDKELPAAAAFAAIGNGVLGTVILAAAVASITKTWTAVAWIASRVLFAQARHGLLPRSLATTDSRSGAPKRAIIVVTVLTLTGMALGRGAILPIVNMASICLALSVILCLIVLLLCRRAESPPPRFVVPGGRLVIFLGFIGAMTMIVGALIEPLLSGPPGVPLEWIMLGVWGVTGAGVWGLMGRIRRRQRSGAGPSPM